MRKKIFVLFVVLLCVLGFVACGKKTASKGVQNEITGWAKDVELYKDETPEELYEKAKKEGKVVIYSVSSRMKKVKESFEKQYPGVIVEAYDISNNELLEKITREYEAGVRTADVIHIKDQDGSIYAEFVKPGIFHAYKPADIVSHIDPFYCKKGMPFYVDLSAWYYNDEAYPDGPPITSWWDLTKPEWKGKILMMNPLDNISHLSILTGLVLDAPALEADYKRVFGEEITLHGTENAGYELLKRLSANDVIFMNSGSEMVESVGTRGQTNPPVAFASSVKMRERKAKNFAIQIASKITPHTGISGLNALYIVNEAPHPAGAKLLIRYLMGEADGKGEGFKPFNTIGGWPIRDDVEPVDPVPFSDINTQRIDSDEIYNKVREVADFWLSIQG